MTNKEIGKRIEIARINAGFNKKELAQKIKVADSTIKRYEDGEISKIKIPIIESIAFATSVNPLWIIGKSDSMELYETNDKEEKMVDLFSLLNEKGQDKAIEQVELLTKIPEYKTVIHEMEQIVIPFRITDNGDFKEATELNAAHERTDIDVTDEMRKHDDDIMNDDSEWE